MGLDVTAPTGLGETVESQLHDSWQTLDDILVMTIKEGFMPVDRPQYAPPVLQPEQLDNLTPEAYHLLVAQLSAWKTYSQSILATLECGIEEYDNEMEQVAAAIRAQIRKDAASRDEKKPPEDAIKDEVRINPRYNELVKTRQTLIQKKKVIETYLDRFGRELRILSRALEMRRQELETGSGEAGNNYNRKRPDFY